VEKQYHLQISDGDAGEYVLLTGDPGRVSEIARHFDNAEKIAQNREYITYTGYLDGVKVSAVSTGIGGPSAAIAVEELVKCGAHTFIRIGTCGGMSLDVCGGDLVIATGATREGTDREYLPDGYPCVSDFFVTCALEKAASALRKEHIIPNYHVGVVHCKDSFYGQHDPDSMPISDELNSRWKALIKSGCLASEMECSTIFAIGAARKVRTGGILSVVWNKDRERQGLDSHVSHSTETVIMCATDALRLIIKREFPQN